MRPLGAQVAGARTHHELGSLPSTVAVEDAEHGDILVAVDKVPVLDGPVGVVLCDGDASHVLQGEAVLGGGPRAKVRIARRAPAAIRGGPCRKSSPRGDGSDPPRRP